MISTFAVHGLDAVPVTVEVDLLNRLPSIAIVGLSALSVRESADRVRSAMLAGGMDFPRRRVVVSLAPADLRKDGTGFDLPIAVAIMEKAGQIPPVPEGYAFAGELTLGGELRDVRGAAAFGRQHPDITLVCGEGMARRVAAMGGRAVGICTLGQVTELSSLPLTPAPLAVSTPAKLDFADTRVDFEVLQQLAMAAHTRTPVLLVGPPGCGKTMLAARCPGLLPDLNDDEIREVTAIRDAAGLMGDASLRLERPFRAPHHSISVAGMLGGARLRPGECSLAHRGVLFLDEIAEFPRHVREAMRAPEEDKQIALARAGGRVVLPSDYWLVMATNPCPCGNLGHPARSCACSPDAIDRHQARVHAVLPKGTIRITITPTKADALRDDTPRATTTELREWASSMQGGGEITA